MPGMWEGGRESGYIDGEKYLWMKDGVHSQTGT